MKLLMCNCRQCRSGRSLSRAGKLYKTVIRQKRSGVRQQVRNMLRYGVYDMLPDRVYIGYTD